MLVAKVYNRQTGVQCDDKHALARIADLTHSAKGMRSAVSIEQEEFIEVHTLTHRFIFEKEQS